MDSQGSRLEGMPLHEAKKSVDEDGVGRYLCFTSGTDGDLASFPRTFALYSNSEPEDCVTSRY